jgi:hypothetical protein
METAAVKAIYFFVFKLCNGIRINGARPLQVVGNDVTEFHKLVAALKHNFKKNLKVSSKKLHFTQSNTKDAKSTKNTLQIAACCLNT